MKKKKKQNIEVEITYEEFEIPSDYPIKNPHEDFSFEKQDFKSLDKVILTDKSKLEDSEKD